MAAGVGSSTGSVISTLSDQSGSSQRGPGTGKTKPPVMNGTHIIDMKSRAEKDRHWMNELQWYTNYQQGMSAAINLCKDAVDKMYGLTSQVMS